MHVASNTLSISSSSSSLHFSYYGRNYGFDSVINNGFESYLFIILSCSFKQFINFFSFFFFCHYFMYPNNNLHQKLAVSEILNNVSLSLSIYFGDPIATSCVLLFIYFLDGCIMSTNGWRKKNFLYKIGIFFLFYFILFCIFSSKSKQSFSLNCLKDCPCQQQVTIGSTVKGVTLWNFIWNFVLWWY